MMMPINSEQLFDVVNNVSNANEKRLMIEFMATREAYNRNEISNGGMVPEILNPADQLNNPTKCKSKHNGWVKGKDNTPVTQ